MNITDAVVTLRYLFSGGPPADCQDAADTDDSGSLQLTDGYKVATPVNWNHGDRCIIVPAVSNDEAKTLFPEGWDEQRPYLRYVKQPGKK